VKITVVMYLAYSVSKKGELMERFSVGFIPHLGVVGVMVSLLMLQPDFGSSVILLSMMGLMLFVSGARLFYLGLFGMLGLTGAYFAIIGSEYRMKRVLAFLDPWSYRTDIGYQISESLIAIGSGGLTGKGLGNGHGKLGYVPELWNDFIGTIVAEELGVVGIVVLASMFCVLVWRGLRIAMRAEDDFGRYLAFGITALFGLQAGANLFVVTGLAPTKGLTLPFVSFGGSSMIMALFGIGVLLNISRNAPDVWEEGREERETVREERRWDKKRQRILKKRDDLNRRFN
jgi:cell division protein FtsW